MKRATKVVSATENIDIGLTEGSAMLVSLDGATFTGTVDFKSSEDGVTYTNTPYISKNSVTAAPSVAQLTQVSAGPDGTATTYLLYGPLTQARIAVTVSAGTISVTYREVRDALRPFDVAGIIPAPGTVAATRARNAFISQVTAICGGADNVRLFWLPKITDTTATTSEDKDARTFTYDAALTASRLSALGSGVAVDFNGSSNEADVPDNDDFSPGDGLNDSPFSIVSLFNPDTISGLDTILSKHGQAKREWLFNINAGKLNLVLYDESATSLKVRTYNTNLATSTWQLGTVTYDGTRAVSGIALYLNEARVDDTTTTDNAGYVAMENLTNPVNLGFRNSATDNSVVDLFDGKMAFVLLVARQLQQDEVYAIMAACNAFFNLSLS